jgi:hypothetical protein
MLCNSARPLLNRACTSVLHEMVKSTFPSDSSALFVKDCACAKTGPAETANNKIRIFEHVDSISFIGYDLHDNLHLIKLIIYLYRPSLKFFYNHHIVCIKHPYVVYFSKPRGVNEILQQETAGRFQYHNRFFFIYIALLFITASYYLFQWPIIAYDADLWYHLTTGRYILDTGSIPDTSYFSFLSPPREWINYFWLFQVLVYKVFSLSGYQGLIILRTIVYLVLVALIFMYLLKNVKDNRLFAFFVIVFIIYFLFMIPRYFVVRPHILAYLSVVIFLYVLEFKPDRTLFLPLVALISINLYGVMYPVIILICVAYLIESYVRRIKKKAPFDRKAMLFTIPVVISMCAIFATPHGRSLLAVPFTPTAFSSQYVTELEKLGIERLLSFNMESLAPTQVSLFNLLLFIAAVSFITALLKKDLRISHLIMFTGGLFLLSRGIRFIFYFSLLAMPLIKAHPPVTLLKENRKIYSLPALCAAVVMLIMPYTFLSHTFANRPAYPVSYKNLPTGVVTFLKHIKTGGTVLNNPSVGGFYEWELYPDYKIFMDMKVALLFSDKDYYTAVSSVRNEEVFRNVVFKYNPSFVTAPLKNPTFSLFAYKFPDYVPVFFDDVEALYVNKSIYPDIADKYALRINPFVLADLKMDSLTDAEINLLLDELLRIRELYTDTKLTNSLIATIYNKNREYKKALLFSDTITKSFPEAKDGYRLKGDALMGLSRFEEAVVHYTKALKRSSDKLDKQRIYKRILLCFYSTEQFDKAYSILDKSINAFTPDKDYHDYYYFGLTAMEAGKLTESRMFFEFAELNVPPHDVKWKNKIQEQLSRFIVE